jgi:hypothetical protein
MNSLLITQIPSYGLCYTQYMFICYPWLGQHVAGLKHKIIYIS